MSRMIQIAELITELQTIQQRYGNTCVYIRGLAWGAVALNQESEDKRTDPGGALDRDRLGDAAPGLLSACEQMAAALRRLREPHGLDVANGDALDAGLAAICKAKGDA
jgi:hypothetical protein